MKVEIEIKDELVKQFGEKAIQVYLTRKAEKLEELLRQNSPEKEQQPSESDPDEETLKDSWAKFNTRGISC